MGRNLKILCTGDIHVGRRPSRVNGAVDPARCSCAAMFSEIVDRAIGEKVDVVAISGDIVDKENKYHEAFGPVERGLRRLAAAGIDIVAVAGNHDFDVLPRLLEAIGSERCHLLGREGAWQHHVVIRDGVPRLDVVGWSFPGEFVRDSPIPAYRHCQSQGRPVLALLHADLDQPQSRYAPVTLRDLQATPVSMWLLGHVHRPRLIRQEGCPAILYPGSPQAMDPGETGTHGPWIIEFDDAGRIHTRQLPMSLVRYDELTIDLTGTDDKEQLDARIPRALHGALNHSCEECGPLEFCSCRIRLIGATRLHRELRGYCQMLKEQLELSVHHFTVRVDEVVVETRPAVDLLQIAQGNNVPADLARILLQLQQDDCDAQTLQLAAQASELAETICSAKAYQQVRGVPSPFSDAVRAREALYRQGLLLLDELLAQKEHA